MRTSIALIVERDLNAIFVTGPGHGGPGLVANTYLEGTYTEVYPHIGHDEEGLRRLFRQFSFPGGIPSHVAPETPGSINEGGELGYSAACTPTARRSTTPTCSSRCVVGDGEAETGPLATSWHSNKFLNPVARRRRAADPAPERVQDRQSDRAGTHPRSDELRVAARGLRLRAALRRGRSEPRGDARADGAYARPGASTRSPRFSARPATTASSSARAGR